MVRQILGAVAQFEKAALVAKLKGARVRVKAEGGRGEGRKSHAEKRPEVVARRCWLKERDARHRPASLLARSSD